MISSRQAVLSRTSRTGVEPNRSWGSKATRIGQSLEDDLAQDPETGCFQGILARGSGIFEAEIGGGFKKNRAERDSRRPLAGHAREHGDDGQGEQGGERVTLAPGGSWIVKALKEFHQRGVGFHARVLIRSPSGVIHHIRWI